MNNNDIMGKAKHMERNWNIFKTILKEDVKVEDEVRDEKIALAEAIARIKKIVKPELAKDLVLKPDMFKLIKKFIKFLQYAPEDPNNKETIISLISVNPGFLTKPTTLLNIYI